MKAGGRWARAWGGMESNWWDRRVGGAPPPALCTISLPRARHNDRRLHAGALVGAAGTRAASALTPPPGGAPPRPLAAPPRPPPAAARPPARAGAAAVAPDLLAVPGERARTSPRLAPPRCRRQTLAACRSLRPGCGGSSTTPSSPWSYAPWSSDSRASSRWRSLRGCCDAPDRSGRLPTLGGALWQQQRQRQH